MDEDEKKQFHNINPILPIQNKIQQLAILNEQMIRDNFKDSIKNIQKLKLYNLNIENAKKYYHQDGFCLMGALNDCGKKKHKKENLHLSEWGINFNVFKQIDKGNFDRAIDLLDYLKYYMTLVSNGKISDESIKRETVHNRLLWIEQIRFNIHCNYLKIIELTEEYIKDHVVDKFHFDGYKVAGCALFLRQNYASLCAKKKKKMKTELVLEQFAQEKKDLKAKIKILYDHLCDKNWTFGKKVWCHQHYARFLIAHVRDFDQGWRRYLTGLSKIDMFARKELKAYQEDVAERFFKEKCYHYALEIFKVVERGKRSPQRVEKIEKIMARNRARRANGPNGARSGANTANAANAANAASGRYIRQMQPPPRAPMVHNINNMANNQQPAVPNIPNVPNNPNVQNARNLQQKNVQTIQSRQNSQNIQNMQNIQKEASIGNMRRMQNVQYMHVSNNPIAMQNVQMQNNNGSNFHVHNVIARPFQQQKHQNWQQQQLQQQAVDKKNMQQNTNVYNWQQRQNFGHNGSNAGMGRAPANVSVENRGSNMAMQGIYYAQQYGGNAQNLMMRQNIGLKQNEMNEVNDNKSVVSQPGLYSEDLASNYNSMMSVAQTVVSQVTQPGAAKKFHGSV